MDEACGRFARSVLECLPYIRQELRQKTEDLEDRSKQLRREISNLASAIYSADENESTSWEENRLDEAKDELASVRRRQRELADAAAAFAAQARKVENLSTGNVIKAQSFLRSAVADLNALLVHDVTSDATPSSVIASTCVTTKLSNAEQMRKTIEGAKFLTAENNDVGVNEKWKLKNGVSVIFKPSNGELRRASKHLIENLAAAGIPKGKQCYREKAASIVDELLDLNLVPPTEIIDYDKRPGSAQLFMEGFEDADRLIISGVIAPGNYKMLSPKQREDWQLLDQLLGNMDRHENNWMLRRRSDQSFDLVLVDNGLCLSEIGKTQMLAQPASKSAISDINRAKLEGFLSTKDQWRLSLAKLVGSPAVEFMCQRAEGLLKKGFYD